MSPEERLEPARAAPANTVDPFAIVRRERRARAVRSDVYTRGLVGSTAVGAELMLHAHLHLEGEPTCRPLTLPRERATPLRSQALRSGYPRRSQNASNTLVHTAPLGGITNAGYGRLVAARLTTATCPAW